MNKESVILSDWIQFLISQKSHALTYLFGIFSGIIGIAYLSLWYHDHSNVTGYIITLFLEFMLVYTFYKIFFSYIHAKKLLNKIMEGEISNVDEIRKKNYKEGIKMKKNNKGEYGYIYYLEICLIIPILILGFISWFWKDSLELNQQVMLYIALFYLASWWITVIIIEIILMFLRQKKLIKLKNRFKKKPKIFEYAFFLGLFWATALMTGAYSQEISSGLDFFRFLNTFGAAIFCYGFSSACGWYHYIERLDEEW